MAVFLEKGIIGSRENTSLTNMLIPVWKLVLFAKWVIRVDSVISGIYPPPRPLPLLCSFWIKVLSKKWQEAGRI
jgi:hypothetical protein